MIKIISKELIQQATREAAFLLENIPDGPDVILCTLSGAVLFFSDVIRNMERTDFEIDFIKCKSYVSNGEQVACDVQGPFGNVSLKDKNVLVIEDLVDTGRSIEAIYNHLQRYQYKSLTFATLLQRKGWEPDLSKYKFMKCFLVEKEEWLVGYGLDDNDKKRNLPEIYLCNN
jgi:hypoxanthine phosphoribosyltransferase